ncbi:MAG: PAS domain S-box protein [Cytophagaceae bacterium]
MSNNISSFNNVSRENIGGFLIHGGEMGKLIASYNWTSTPVGPIESWPQNLTTTISIIVNSKFPMFLFWGEEHLCFYNDAFRKVLGSDGKHPMALGKPGKEVWPEIWHVIEPMIEQVLESGEATWSEDQLIPIYRNGKLDEVYWTFSYSLVTSESGEAAGVFVTCMETVEKVFNLKKLAEKQKSLELAMKIGNLGSFRVDVSSNTATYSQAIMDWFGFREQGRPISEIFSKIHPEDKLLVEEIISNTLKDGSDGKHDITYRVVNHADGKLQYLHSIGQVISVEDKPVAILGIIQDVTGQVQARNALEEKEKTFRNLVMQTPVAIAVYRGENFKAEIANDAYLTLSGKKSEELIGKPLFELFPDAKERISPLIQELILSGKVSLPNEFETVLNRNGREEVCYFNSVWEALKDNEGSVNGFIVVAHEVTEQVLARKKVEKSESQFRSLIAAAPVAIGLFVGRDLVIEHPNQTFFDIVGKGNDIAGKPLREVMPELITEDQPFLKILDDVYTSGKMYQTFGTMVKIVRNGIMTHNYYDITYTPLFDSEGKVYAILDIAIDVTEQVLVRKRIHENEEQLRIAVEGGELGTYDHNLVTGEYSWSSKAKELFGLSSEETVDEDFFIKCIHSDDYRFVKESLQKAIKSVNNGFYENEYRTIGLQDRKLRWVRSKGKVSFNEEGKAVRFTGILQETTSRKLAEEALKVSNERFQGAVAAIEGVLWTNNAEGKMEGVQPGWAELTGQKYDEYQGYGWSSAIHPDDAQATINAWEEAVKFSKTFLFEHRVRLRDGTYGHFSIRAIPLLNPDHSIREWVGVHTNITEKKLSDLALKESELRFRTLADQSPMFVFLVEPNEEATMSYFNKNWLDYTGQTFEEALGRSWDGIVHPDDVSSILQIYTSAFLNREPYTLPAIRVRKHDGEYRWHLFKGNPRYLTNGEFIGYVGVGIDIHEQKLALEQLELNNEQLKRINNDLDNFIYTASHDLKAPMSNIEGLLHALRSTLQESTDTLKGETSELLDLMDHSVNRFKSTILDLTDITKAQKEEDEDVLKVSLTDILEDVKESIADSILKSKAILKTDFSRIDHIRFSKKNLKSIVYNLLSNAIKYRDENRVSEILIKTEVEGNYIILSVQDNGLGISEANQKKIFSMFKRFHDHVEGTGIGLYIVKRIIDNAGGRIEVQSKEGEGSIFKLCFKNSG